MKRVVLITGGAGGMGMACALKFSERGYKTIVSTRNLEAPKVKIFLESIKEKNLNIDVVEMNLQEPSSISNCINKIINQHKKIDVLINNAATGYFSAVEDIDKTEFMKELEINVLGTVEVIKNVLPHMREVKTGTIINISSILGFSTVPLNAPYSATKYALESISETLAIEVKPFGINVIIVQPGDFHSEFIKKAVHAQYKESSPYLKLYKRKDEKMQQNTVAKDPRIFAQKVYAIAQSKNPRLRYMIGREVYIKKLLHLILIDNLWIKFLRFFYKW